MKENTKVGQILAKDNKGLKTAKNAVSKKAGVKQDPAGLLLSVIQNQLSMYRKEIRHWISARQEAMDVNNPTRTQLLDIYVDIETDAFITGQMQNRILRISNKKFKVINLKSGDEDPEKSDLLKKAWFKDFIKYCIESRAWGYSLIYFNELLEGKVNKVDCVYRHHVVPEKGIIVKRVGDADGISYLDAPLSNFCIGVGKPKDLGLYEKAALLYILKKHSWSNWDQFEEIFGIPIRTAKTTTMDPKVLSEIEKWLKDMGSAAYGLFPQGTELDIKEHNKTDAYKVFNEKRLACNEELAVLINGQFETSKETGSRAKADSVIESTQDEITKDDMAMVVDVVNDELIPRLRMLGYPFADDDRFEFSDTKELSTLEKLEVYKGVSDMGFEIDSADIEAQFGVKVVGLKQTSPSDPVKTPGGGQGKKPSAFHDAHAKAVMVLNIPTYEVCTHGPANEDTGFDDTEFKDLEKLIIEGINNKEYDSIVPVYHNKLIQSFSKALEKGWESTGISIDYDSPDHTAITMMEVNLHRFAAAKNLAMVQSLNQLLTDTKNFSEFKAQASKLLNQFNTTYLRTEYNFSFAVAQNAANYRRQIRDAEEFPYLQYNTIGDDRVREAHRALEGKVFKIDDPAVSVIYPPNGWGCRCEMLPLADVDKDRISDKKEAIKALSENTDKNGVSEWDKMRKGGFDKNRGELQQVFEENKMYVKSFDDSKLGIKDYQLKPFEAIKGGYSKLDVSIDTKAKANDWFTEKQKEQNVDGKASVLFTNHRKAPIELSLKTFEKHLTQKYIKEGRQKLVNHLPEILANPDEVFVVQDAIGKYSYRYIKFYNENPIIVITEIEAGDKPQIIKTWFELTNEPDNRRSGVLSYLKNKNA